MIGVKDPMAALPTEVDERLAGFGTFQECLNSIRVNLFRVLIDLSVDTVRNFRGDFYHDCEWIQRMIVPEHWDAAAGQMGFYYCFDDSGTYISQDPAIGLYRKHAYRLVLLQRGQAFHLIGAKVKG